MFRALPLLATLIALWGAPVAAQMICGERAGMVAKLDSIYGEIQHGGGLVGPSSLYEVWASCKTGTWTILKTTPNGWACVVAAGRYWQGDCIDGKLI